MRILSVMTFAPAAQSGPPTQEDMERMGSFIAQMRGSGVLIDTGGRMPGMLELSVARRDGTSTVTDGPFTETKEVVGGYALLEVKDRDEAISVTNRFLDLVGNATCTLHEVEVAP
jgi:hypothetical protein